jgi:hypothetical protein
LKTLKTSCTITKLNPYQNLTMPIIRAFYPKLIAGELASVQPMNSPNDMAFFINKFYKVSRIVQTTCTVEKHNSNPIHNVLWWGYAS